MLEREENQHIQPGQSAFRQKIPKHTVQVWDTPPALITKKWLCWRLDLVRANGRPKYPTLYQKVLTPEVLSVIGTSEREIRRLGFTTFNREQTVALIRILAL